MKKSKGNLLYSILYSENNNCKYHCGESIYSESVLPTGSTQPTHRNQELQNQSFLLFVPHKPTSQEKFTITQFITKE